MSTTIITEPVILDKTGQQLVAQMHKQNALLEVIASDKLLELTTNLREIHELVRDGLAPEVLGIGDQINVPWSDGNGNSYTIPFDVVHHGEVELADGEKIPGMYIQWHYATPFGIPFDYHEALYVNETGAELPAGNYYFTMGNGWGTHVISGKSYFFTLTQPLPNGGVLAGLRSMPDVVPSSWRIYSYANAAATASAPIETCVLTEGTSGTNLGTLSSSTKYNEGTLNNMQRVGYGYNRWSQSALRQWLNSSSNKGSWWTPQNKYDTAPTELASYQGFMKGFRDAVPDGVCLLDVIKPVKVRTALNTVSDSAIGSYEDTFDYFFPASLEQEFCAPQAAGIEGEAWGYWKRTLGSATPQPQYSAWPNHIRYAINGKTSAHYCRLRSALRGTAYGTWYVYTSGHLGSTNATNAHRCAPACVIC